jgi:hypothetical protein
VSEAKGLPHVSRHQQVLIFMKEAVQPELPGYCHSHDL